MNYKHSRLYITFLFLVLFSRESISQTEILSSVQSKVNEYNTKLLPEKLYVHTDKDFYTAGDIMWFKIYSFDGFYNKPLKVSRIAYIEILDQNKIPVTRAKIELNEKGGKGSFQLPLSLTSGDYTVKAYTSWMKNLGPGQFFSRRITVVNPLKNPVKENNAIQPLFNLEIYPEGGNLVNGLLSRVAFKLTDQYGKGLDANGFLIDNNNDTLSVFTPFKFGMGSFNILPRPGHTYRVAFIFPDGRFVSEPLPQSFDSGYVMHTEEIEDSKIRITVLSNASQNYPEIYLLAQSQKMVKLARRGIISNGMASFIIDKKDLSEGISQLTIFDNNRKPVCERLFFIQPSPGNRVQVNAAKRLYGKRDRVSLQLEMPGLDHSNLSVSVFQDDPLQSSTATDMLSFIWLRSELMGIIEDPGYYFSGNSNETRKASDFLMMTHGWRRFNWETVLNENPVVKYPAENSGHLISVRVTDTKTAMPAENVQVFLSVPNTQHKLYSAISNENGIALFDVRDFYGPGELIIQTNPQRDSSYRVELLSPFAEDHVVNKGASLMLSEDRAQSLVNYSIAMQARHIYIADSLNRFSEKKIKDSFLYYGRPLQTYQLDDYKRFATMEEVLREYVREINVGVKGSGNSLRFKIFNKDRNDHFTENILVTVDGVPMFNPNKVFSYDPLQIKSIDIITSSYVMGMSIFHAVANFSSYKGNFEGFDADPEALTVDYEGLQLQRRFYSPEYSSSELRNSRIPDLRSTLYWSPDVTSGNIEFYTGDNKGRYIAIFQGVDADGKVIGKSISFEVE